MQREVVKDRQKNLAVQQSEITVSSQWEESRVVKVSENMKKKYQKNIPSFVTLAYGVEVAHFTVTILLISKLFRL